MRLLFGSGLLLSLLVLVACGEDSEASNHETVASGDGSTDDASTGVGGREGGTGGTGGRSGLDGGGTSGSGGSTGATGGTSGEAGVPSCTLSDSWQTIVDFQLAPGEHSNPAAIAAAPPNRLYAVGVARMGTFQWHVRRSEDGGGTWEAVDEGMTGGAADVVVDSRGAIFVVGSSDAGRIVRRSIDNGDSWFTVDTIPGGTGTDPCSAGALAKTANDAIYVAASCDSTGVVVRRSTNGGDTWTPVDSFQYTTTAQTRMGTLGADASGQAYVGGTGGQPLDGSNHWLVRRGTGTGTWTTVDDYQLAPANHAGVANFFGSADAIYVVGSANDASGASHWIIRRASVDDPSSFTTVDDVGPTQNLEQLAAQNVYQASTGLFVAAGSSKVGTAPGRVVYRRSTDGGATWNSAGDFQYVTGADSAPSGGITEDAAGNLYGMVRGVDADGFAHWIIRRLMCN